jgi:N-acetylneuraminic acid mutarotase
MFLSFWGFLLVFDAAASVVNYEKSFGTAPQPRKKALMVFRDEELLVFGGMQDQDLWFDDIWAFDLLSGSWTEIFSVNQGPGMAYFRFFSFWSRFCSSR